MAKAAMRKSVPRESSPSPNVLLIGLRASGKSTVGRALAERLERQFIDLDLVTLWRLKATTVAEAWASHGESAFRRMEVDGLRDACGQADRVVALGGGTPTAPGAIEVIRNAQEDGRAFVVYLHAPPDVLRSRMAATSGEEDPDRPTLTGADPLEEVDRVYEARDPLYRDLADLIVESRGGPEEAIRDISGVVIGLGERRQA